MKRVYMKVIKVTMPDNSIWAIPTNIIAHNRASYYARMDSETDDSEDQDFREAYKKEFESCLHDSFDLIDWLSNNMTWEMVKDSARRIFNSDPEPDYEEGICNGKKEYTDVDIKLMQ